MFQIQNTLVSKEVLEQKFVCNLSACQGACCVEGDSGAPLEDSEEEFLQQNFDNIKPFLRKEGVKAIEEFGTSLLDEDGDCVTPLVNGKECAYTVFSSSGIASCGIEKAFEKGAINFQKPISCHLYPIRLSKIQEFTVLNYHEWKICKPACDFGKQLKIDLIDFLEKPLIRKFGIEWFTELKEIKNLLNKSEKNNSNS